MCNFEVNSNYEKTMSYDFEDIEETGELYLTEEEEISYVKYLIGVGLI